MTKAKTIEYLPMSKEVFQESLIGYKNGHLPCLDIELSAICKHGSCIYCDSKVGKPYPDELELKGLMRILEEGKKLGVKWLFICGLGEPLDDPKFFKLLDYASKNGMEVSLFTNGLRIDEDVAKLFAERKVNLIVKCDSLEERLFDKLLGKRGTARRIYRAIDNLLEAGYEDNYEIEDGKVKTHLALSIVPTKINIDTIPEVVEYCKRNNIYPHIGELEFSGKAKTIWKKYAVSFEKLQELKEKVDKILGYGYSNALCPSTIASLHVNNVGKVMIDRKTGLSCGWFWLREPDLIEVGDTRKESLSEILRKVRDYREGRIDDIRRILERVEELVFGGCGGKVREILEIYLHTLEYSF